MKINDFLLERYFARHEFTSPCNLCCSACETFSQDELLGFDDSYIEQFMNLRLGYTESLGASELRAEISRLYDTIEPDDIIVFSGAEEAIFIYMNILLEPGDHVIVQFPAYQSLFQVAESLGAEVTRLTLNEDRGWEFNLDLLKESLTPKTKAIVVNFPHNPTGYLMPKDKYFELMEIAAEHGIHIFSDEVYQNLEQDKSLRLPSMCDLHEDSLSLGVMSKSFGLAGLRIGWLASKNEDLMKKIAGFKDYTTICNSAPSEFLATVALKHKEQLWKRNLEIISDNLPVLDDFLSNHQDLFSWIRPKAGPIAFPGLLFTDDADSFCNDLLKSKGVLLLPGSRFLFGNSHFRIGFGGKCFDEGFSLLQEYLFEKGLTK